MPFRLTRDETLEEGTRRVATDLLDDAVDRLSVLDDDPASVDVAHTVHEIRKRCKEMRGLLRLVRGAIGEEFDRADRDVRGAAHELSAIRDAHAVQAAVEELPTAVEARVGLGEDGDLRGGDPRIARARRRLVKVRRRVSRWDIDDRFASLAPGLRETYRRGRRGHRRAVADPTDHHVHEWRKSVKYLWYQTRLLEPAAPSMLSPLVARLDDLARALGDDHDLAVMIERMTASPKRFGGKKAVRAALAVGRAQQADLRHRAFLLGARVYAEPPRGFADRVERYWSIDREMGDELPTGGIADLVDLGEPVAGGGASRIERERKFVLTSCPERLGGGERIRQGYLAVDGTVSVRIRDADGARTFTVKGGQGAVRTELEFELGPDDFEALWSFTHGRCVNKTRHEVLLDDHTALIDVFEDELAGLILAEVEFAGDEEMAAFHPPDWFGPEVTDDPAYTNARLAVSGRPLTTPVARSDAQPAAEHQT